MELAIALAQMHITPGKPGINIKKMESFIKDAAKRGAQLIVFPEDCITGPLAHQTAFIDHAPAYLAHFSTLAIKHKIDIVPGTWVTREAAALYNTAHYINADGTLAGAYHKIHLWDTEKALITPGAAVSVFPTTHARVGLITCWDISFPDLFLAMNQQGVDLVIAPTYWSFTKPAKEVADVVDEEILLIDALCTTRAFENDIVFAYCNAAGTVKDGPVTAVLSGRSQITHPTDKVICKAESNAEELLFARVVHHKAGA